MLTLQSMTGYNLRSKIEETIGYFWQESFGQLYPALVRLEKEGLVKSQTDSTGERTRYVYSITRQGRAKLHSWLEQSPVHHVERNELLMKIFFATEVDVATPIAHISESRADAIERLKVLQNMSLVINNELIDKRGYDYYWATLRNGELGLEAHIRWCDEVLVRLKASAL